MIGLTWTCRLARPTVLLGFMLMACSASAMDLETMGLPPLRISGVPARAHTQGLEIVDGNYYVTARREDVAPKRALLLRCGVGEKEWRIWDITPVENGRFTSLDHPGGLQFDGERLWIPISESQRGGRTLVRAYSLKSLVPGKSAPFEREFTVEDHIGALAVFSDRQLMLGANWDTEKVYIWNTAGQLQRTLSGKELQSRQLGVGRNENGEPGLAVQDWKVQENRLFAAGLVKQTQGVVHSRLIEFVDFLGNNVQSRSFHIGRQENVELCNEGMTVQGGNIYFLPEDLGETNRLFRADLGRLRQGKPTRPAGH